MKEINKLIKGIFTGLKNLKLGVKKYRMQLKISKAKKIKKDNER